VSEMSHLEQVFGIFGSQAPISLSNPEKYPGTDLMQLRIFPLGSFPLVICRTPEQRRVGDGTVSDGVFGSLVGSAVPRYKRVQICVQGEGEA
jgi:hypothetical protein